MRKSANRWVCSCLAMGLWLQAWADPSAFSEDSVRNPSDPVEERPVVRRSWYPIPMAFYQEETSVGFGVVGGYYFKSNSLHEISSITGSVIYTLRKQAKIHVNPRFYTRNGRLHFVGDLHLRYYPEKFYGVGAQQTNEGMDYISKAVSFRFQPFYRIRPDLEAGMVADFRAEMIPGGGTKAERAAEMYGRRDVSGWEPYLAWGMGLQMMYDTRDNVAYPQRFSHFLKVGWITYQQAWGSCCTMNSFSLDFRQFVPTWIGQVFAWQVCAEMRVGHNTPFGMLPTLGGSDLLRGFREKTYTDNALVAVQAEYRIPIWRRLKAAVFAGVGDVFDLYHPEFGHVEVGYGAGLRLRLNDARVHLRVDVAGNNEGQVKFYITATEAF
ncbi:MAG: BamA/TamA family outer membrane protein [Paludibacteraceae bacterium]|nr:BamA/TamA family outer membrane protein [Paludibacteraceae bacterium]